MSGIYTVLDNPQVDAFIQTQLDRIVEAISRLLGGHLVAVVLGGGFGRGEGSVMVDADGAMHVVNDYDIEVVYRERWGRFPSKALAHLRFHRGLARLAGDLANELGLKQIDLVLRGVSGYRVTGVVRLADFDIRSGHRLLYGRHDPVQGTGTFDPAEIPAFEGTWLLRNRAIGLLLAWYYLVGDSLRPDKAEYFFIEINKAVLAMGDALFIGAGRYRSSYAWRADHLADVLPAGFGGRSLLEALYALAADYKLRPTVAMYPGQDPAGLWRRVSALFVDLFLYHESQRAGRGFARLADYADWLGEPRKTALRGRLRFGFDRLRGAVPRDLVQFAWLRQSRPHSVLVALTLLGARLEGDSGDSMAALTGLIGTGNRDELMRSFLLFAHPKGELGRELGRGAR
jgi:hypothetical protein